LAAEPGPRVEIEEDVYRYTNANNGAGPMWCHGSTCLVRSGDRLFASGLETIPGAKPLNNCRWMLFERGPKGWVSVRVDAVGRTREPAPLTAFDDGRIFLSVNPTLAQDDTPGSGPARPDVLEFQAACPAAQPVSLSPVWKGEPSFTEHSYRNFAADGPARELVLFQNIGYTHAEWAFRDRQGRWSAQGQLNWPWEAHSDTPGPVRICYSSIELRRRAVHVCGVSDILEPNKAWREFKRRLTGKEWDYDFRRLFYTWTPDITSKPFAAWAEIASREDTCGWIMPCDLHVAANGDVHLVWTDRALDERLRPEFFPDAKQSHTLNHAVIREGKVIRRQAIEHSTEATPGIVGSAARFQVAPNGRLFVAYYASGTDKTNRRVSENRLVEVVKNASLAAPVPIPLQRPFVSFFTATVRGGSPPSRTLELLGEREGSAGTISYARVRMY
jgi:hypothetical protein